MRVALLAALAEHPAEALGAGDAVGAGAVHGDVAVAFEQAHQPADLVEHRALLGRWRAAPTSPPSSSGLRPPRTSSTDAAAAPRRSASGSGSTASSVCSTSARKCPHPRHAGELGPVGDLVQREPQPELAGREGEALLEREDVGPDVVDEVLVVGVLVLDDEQVVLAEHPASTSSRAARRARRRPRCGRAARARRCADAFAEPVGERAQQALERRDVGPDPAGPVDDPGPGRAGQRAQTGRVGRQLLGLAVSSAKSGASEA